LVFSFQGFLGVRSNLGKKWMSWVVVIYKSAKDEIKIEVAKPKSAVDFYVEKVRYLYKM